MMKDLLKEDPDKMDKSPTVGKKEDGESGIDEEGSNFESDEVDSDEGSNSEDEADEDFRG